METISEAVDVLNAAWPHIVEDCRQALGSELYYQALVYHCLRSHGKAPLRQLGMNVKMRIMQPVSALFRQLDEKKHEDYRGGFEPIPDVCLFSSQVNGDWRRRQREQTLASLLLALEIKASEREGARLHSGEIIDDIKKLAAQREEARARGSDFLPVVMVIDTAPEPTERMTAEARNGALASAERLSVGFLYLSPTEKVNTLRSFTLHAALEPA